VSAMKQNNTAPKSPFDRGGRRKPLYGEPMKRSTFKLPPFMRDWLKEQPGGMSETVRRLVRERMEVNND